MSQEDIEGRSIEIDNGESSIKQDADGRETISEKCYELLVLAMLGERSTSRTISGIHGTRIRESLRKSIL